MPVLSAPPWWLLVSTTGWRGVEEEERSCSHNLCLNPPPSSLYACRVTSLSPGSQVRWELAFFGSFLVSGFCSAHVMCSDGGTTCKRGPLGPADKCMLRVTVVQPTLDFKSHPV